MACGVVAFGLLGCGGETSDRQFRSKVDGICKRSQTDLAAIPAPPPTDFAANGRYAGQVIVVLRKVRDRLKAVEAPSAKKSDYEQWVSTLDELGGVIARRGVAAAAGDAATFNSLVEQENTLLQASKSKAALLGFQRCSK